MLAAGRLDRLVETLLGRVNLFGRLKEHKFALQAIQLSLVATVVVFRRDGQPFVQHLAGVFKPCGPRIGFAQNGEVGRRADFRAVARKSRYPVSSVGSASGAPSLQQHARPLVNFAERAPQLKTLLCPRASSSSASEVAVLRGGIVAQIATPETLYRQPVDVAMARFVGEAVILPGIVIGGAATCALGRLPLARPTPDGPADVMVRPEQIRFVATPNAEAPRGLVIAVTYYGHDASVRLALAGRRRRSRAASLAIARRDRATKFASASRAP